MQITKHPTKQLYVATQLIKVTPTNESGVAMPSFYMAEGHTIVQAMMGVMIMIAALCIRFKTHPDKLEMP